MAKVGLDAALKALRGRLDGVVYRKILGIVVASRLPQHNKKRKRSAAEAATNARLAEASRRAKFASPEMTQRYAERAKLENNTLHSIRTRDYMVPPTITAVDLRGYTGQPGEEILVTAHDDFEVKEVIVRLKRSAHDFVEEGRATPCGGDVFRYITQTALPADTPVTIEVIARDWPENHARWQCAWPEPKPV